MYREALFRVTGLFGGERWVIGVYYTEQEAQEVMAEAPKLGYMFCEVNISRFIRELV